MKTVDNEVHIPVMMKEVMAYLDPAPGEFMIDGTLGGGGHAREIVRRITPKGTFLGVDRDERAIERNKGIFGDGVKVILVNSNYSGIAEIISKRNLPKADGILLDLGFSSIQLEDGRGFSFMKNEPLLMTYSDEEEPLMDVLKRLSEKEIKEIVAISGEKYSGRIATAIWKVERKGKIRTTGELASVIRDVVPKGYEKGRIDPATRTFLAFRIFINDELGHLKRILESLPQILKPGGRAVVITFQSLEDGMVKNVFRDMAKEGICEVMTKKPIPVSYGESRENPRARSAKVRAMIIK